MNHLRIQFAVWITAALAAAALCHAPGMAAETQALSIQCADRQVNFLPEQGRLVFKQRGRTFLEDVSLGDFLPGAMKASQVELVKTPRGRQSDPPAAAGQREAPANGPVATLRIKGHNGRRVAIWLHDELPFVGLTPLIHNSGDKPLAIDRFVPLSGLLAAPGAQPSELRALGYEGLSAGDQPKATYLCLAVADPRTGAGVVCGWLTHDRASAVVLGRTDGGRVRIEPRSEYGRLRVSPGNTVQGETLLVGYFDNVFEGLEAYAEAIARHYRIKVRPVPSGYMTWYHARALDEKRMPVLARWCSEHLNRYGFDFLQIDDGWQIARRDFTTWAVDRAYNDKKPPGPQPRAPYAQGMKPVADAVRKEGLMAGIWITPFGWDHTRPVFAEHQDWFVHRADGSVYSVSWGGDCLDMSHPEARRFLHEVMDRIANEWGYKFFKLDALWAGMCVKILYPNPNYRDDGLGDAVFHDPEFTNVQAFRTGLRVCREAAGRDAYLLGCTAAQNPRTLAASIGLVDAIRVGRDSGHSWQGIVSNVKISSSIYYLHHRVWHNDPDVLYLESRFSLDQVRSWASWLAVTGNLYMVSNWLPDVPADRLDVVKRTIPNHNLMARPVDLFEMFPARLWHLHSGQGAARRDIVAAFNWGEEEVTMRIDPERLGLGRAVYAAFDFWADEPCRIGPGESLVLSLRPQSCVVLSLKRLDDHPVLVSTSRHVTQGIVDLVEEKWEALDAGGGRLSGVSRLVADDPYELRIALPPGESRWRVSKTGVDAHAQQAGASIKVVESDAPELVRVLLTSPASGEFGWQITFSHEE